MKITINGLQHLQKTLDNLSNKSMTELHLLPQNICQVEIAPTQRRFKTAIYDGYNDVKVSYTADYSSNGNVYDSMLLKAEGSAVCYIEFGTGVYYNGSVGSYNYPIDVSDKGIDPIGMHSFSGNQLSEGANDFWWYKGMAGTNGYRMPNGKIYTHGNPSNLCLYETAQEIKDIVRYYIKKGMYKK